MALEPSVGPEPELLDGRQTLPWDYFPLARDPLNGWQLEAVSQTTSYFGWSFSARQPRTSAVNIEPSGARAIWWGSK